MNLAGGDLGSPYQGLVPYSAEDADRFFGRESDREIVISNLMARRLTVLYGESGVGKSSLLAAGVVHHLRLRARRDLAPSERGRARAVAVLFGSWGGDPIAAFAEALQQQLQEFVPGGNGVEAPESSDVPGLIGAWTSRLGSKMLVILDQFEEYFLYPEAAAFGQQLPHLLESGEIRANFLIAIREDALAHLDEFKGRIPGLMANRLRIRHLDRKAARSAIEKPIAYYNERHGAKIEIEPALVDRVLSQVEAGKVTLAEQGRGTAEAAESRDGEARIEAPYLQLVMTRLWEQEHANGSSALRVETLDLLGGAQEIVRTHLDEAMAGLDDGQREIAAEVFHYLVTPSGAKIAFSLGDLAYLVRRGPDELGPLFEGLQKARILRPVSEADGRASEVRYEIFHDVLGGAVLDWRKRHVQQAEQRQLEARVDEERQQKLDAEREAEQARERALQERRRARIFRAVTIVCVGLMVVAALGFVYAFSQKNRANDLRRSAEKETKRTASILLAARSRDEVRPDRALLVALEAFRVFPTFEARSSILQRIDENPALPLLLVGHDNAVQSLAFSPDSRILASAGSDADIRLWNATTGAALGPPIRAAEIGSIVKSLSFRRNADTLASAADNGTVKLWDVTSPGHPRLLRQLVDQETGFNAVAFNPAGTLLAAAEDGEFVRLWSFRGAGEPHPLPRIQTGDVAIGALAFSPDNRLLAVAGDEGVRLWDVSGSASHAIGPRLAANKELSSVAIDRAGKTLAAGTSGGDVHLWDISNPRRPRPKATLSDQNDTISGLAFFPDRPVLVSGSYDNSVEYWDLSARPPVPFGPPRTHLRDVDTVTVAPDGSAVASAGDDSTVKLWRSNGSEPALAVRLGSGASVWGAALASTGSLVAAAGRALRFWDARPLLNQHADPSQRSPRPILVVPSKAENAYSQAVINRGKLVATADGIALTLWDTTNPRRPRRLGTAFADSSISYLAWSGDGKTIASGGYDNDSVGVFDVSDPGKPRMIRTFHAHGTEVDAIAFSRRQPILATATEDGTLRLWDLKKPARPAQLGKPLRGHEAGVYSIAFSPARPLLASGSADDTIAIWDLTDPRHPKLDGEPLRLRNTVNSVTFSDDGSTIAAGDGNSQVSLWSLAKRDVIGGSLELHDEYTHDGAVDVVQFADNGAILLSGGRDNPLALWRSDLWRGDFPTLRRYACTLAHRNLSDTEWARFFSETPLAAKPRKTCPV